MSEAGRSVLVVILVGASVLLVVQGPPRPDGLGPPEPADPCDIAIERAGRGVSCVEEGALPDGLRAGDRLFDGGVGRMAPERIELFHAPVDINRASPAELTALPGVGPQLAQRIAASRPFASIEELRAVPGIGAVRWAAIAPRVQLIRPPP